MKALNAARKADREKIAAELTAALTAAGGIVEREPPRDYAPRRIVLTITAPGGAEMSVSIDAALPDICGGTWNTPGRLFLSPSLGDVNPFHWSKLNRFSATWQDLATRLSVDLAMFADGSGYLPESDPRIVAMRAGYRENGWPWFGEAA